MKTPSFCSQQQKPKPTQEGAPEPETSGNLRTELNRPIRPVLAIQPWPGELGPMVPLYREVHDLHPAISGTVYELR